MNKLKGKIMESLASVMPITLLVIALSAFVVPMPGDTLLMFLGGAVLLIVGMGFFSLGADMSMMPMGEGVGKQITLLRKLSFSVPVCFLLGAITTIAEPDLQVLARQVPAVPDMTLILVVAAGVGVFLVAAMLRPLFKIDLARVLLVLYAIVFVLAYFTPSGFVPVAFDAGGVTTGPITVPFIISLGVGMASMRHDSASQEDSFGLVSLCSVGPILMVLLLGLIFKPGGGSAPAAESAATAANSIEIAANFLKKVPAIVHEVFLALLPVVAFFNVFQGIFVIFRRNALIRITFGVVYTFIGLVLFLTGVNVGFMPAGHFIGKTLAESAWKWALLPIGFVIGYYVVDAEPAVHVLNKQVEAFFVPRVFTGIAFDSGGVASGPMTATFLLPLAMGACEGAGGSVLTDAFGVVAMVAMTPLISIQILGLMYAWKLRHASDRTDGLPARKRFAIVEYDQEVIWAHE